MSKKRFEVFGNIIKDNEDIPALLNNYQATVRLNEFNEKIKDLQSQLDQANERLNEHNEYFKAFNCKDFKEFQDFISSFMLTPHEEQTLIKDLQNQLNQANERIMWLSAEIDTLKSEKENLMQTLEEASEELETEAEKKLQELRGGDFSGE